MRSLSEALNELLSTPITPGPINRPIHKKKDRLPNIYLAGKIRKNCWRHKLVDGLRGHSWDHGPLVQRAFTYVGPFFVCCDHGCFHNKNSHGAIAVRGGIDCLLGDEIFSDFDYTRRNIVTLCFRAVAKCDLLFCYIDSADCYGTLVEVGYAHAHHVPVIILFSPGIASSTKNDHWFACEMASEVHYNVREEDLRGHLNCAIKRYSCP